MKRYIKASEQQESYAIAGYVNNKIVGYLFKYSESRGISVARLDVDSKYAKTYPSQASAKRALAYYRNYCEVYLYSDPYPRPIEKYMRWKDGFDFSSLNEEHLTHHDIKDIHLDVVKL